ncbi:hypothetical protein Tco_0038472 [Tanacetum coccineum]
MMFHQLIKDFAPSVFCNVTVDKEVLFCLNIVVANQTPNLSQDHFLEYLGFRVGNLKEAIRQDKILALIWKEIVPTIKQLKKYCKSVMHNASHSQYA